MTQKKEEAFFSKKVLLTDEEKRILAGLNSHRPPLILGIDPSTSGNSRIKDIQYIDNETKTTTCRKCGAEVLGKNLVAHQHWHDSQQTMLDKKVDLASHIRLDKRVNELFELLEEIKVKFADLRTVRVRTRKKPGENT